MNKQFNQVEALAISLHQQIVAVLVHYSGGQNNLIFSPTYKALLKESQSTLTLTQLAKKDYLEQTLYPLSFKVQNSASCEVDRF